MPSLFARTPFDPCATLYDAVHDGDLLKVQQCLTAGVDPNALGVMGQVPMVALNDRRGTAGAILQRLLDAGADPNARNADGSDVLHRLITMRRVAPMVALVLDVGADPMAMGGYRVNGGEEPVPVLPLDHALVLGAHHLVELLLDRVGHPVWPLDPCAVNPHHGWTALHWACNAGEHDADLYAQAVRRLIGMGADPDLEHHVGETPRQMACDEVAQALCVAMIAREQRELRKWWPCAESSAARPRRRL